MATAERGLVMPQKMETRASMRPSLPSPGHTPETWETVSSQRHTCPYVHCSIMHSSQDMEMAKGPCDGGQEKMWAVYTTGAPEP